MTTELVQGSPEWIAARIGSLGASRMGDATARTKSGYGASRANLMAELVVERLTGKPYDRYVSREMQFGTEQEPSARAAYEWLFDTNVETCGLFRHPEIEGTHASPDGLIADDGLVEIKVPNSAQHIDVLMTKTIPERYHKQMQWQMACTGRKFCDFVTFDPNMPPELQLWVFRVMRDEKAIAELEKEARLFLAELDEKVEALRKIGRMSEAA